MALDDLLEGRHVREVLAAQQQLAHALELVLDGDERRQHAVAIVNGGVNVGDRARLAGAPLIDGERLQAMQQHQLGVEPGSILFDQRRQLARVMASPTPVPSRRRLRRGLAHASRIGVSSFRASSLAVTSFLSATSSSREVM